MRCHRVCAVAGLLGLALDPVPEVFAASSALEMVPARVERDGRPATEVFSSVRYFSASDWTSVGDIGGDWSARFSPRSGRNVAVEFLHAEIGVARGSWRLSYLRRHEVIVRASRDAVELFYLEKNNLPIPAGRRYALSLEANALDADALRIQKTFELRRGETSTLRALLGGSLIRGKRTRTATMQGEVTRTGSNVFSLDANWSDSYTKKTYPFLTPGSPEGSGYAVEAAVEFRWAEKNRLTLCVEDLGARIAWRDVPSTDARATSNTAARDARGFLVYQPAIVGQNQRKAYTQRLDTKTTFQYSRTLDAFSIDAGVRIVGGIVMPRVAIGYRLDDAWRLTLERDLRFGSVGLGLQYKHLSVAASIEGRDPDKAMARGLAAQLVVPF